ncbi:MAG: hypothetical protein WCO14_03105 [bacterium]
MNVAALPATSNTTILTETGAIVRRSSRSLLSLTLLFLASLLFVTLVAQVYFACATIESKHREEITRTEAAELEVQVFELKSRLEQRLTPLAVETFAKQQLQMDYAHAIPQVGIVYLKEEDRASFAQSSLPGDGGYP